MLKHLALLFTIFLGMAAKAQYIRVYTNDAYSYKNAKKFMLKDMKKSLGKKMMSSYSLSDSGDTLITTIHYSDSSEAIVKLTFKHWDEITQAYLCDRQEWIFNCGKTAVEYIEQFKKECECRQLSDSKCLTRYKWHSEIEVSYPKGKECPVMTLKFVNKTEDEYEKWYNSLK